MPRGFLKVKGSKRELALGSGGQLSKIDLKRPVLPWEKRLAAEAEKLSNGIYRVITGQTGGRPFYKLNPKRLDASSLAQEIGGRKRKGSADTGRPGIAGYQQAAHAASTAAGNKKREAEAFVKWLKEEVILTEVSDFQRAMSKTGETVAIGWNRIAVKTTLAKHSLGDRVKIVKFVREKTPVRGAGSVGKPKKTEKRISYNIYIDEKWIAVERKLDKATRTAKRKLGVNEERDYKDEYKKFQSSKKSKKYRAELNKYNRKKGTYGNGDGQDASHKGGKISGTEPQSKNRGRREKSRLKKEGLRINLVERKIKSLGSFKNYAGDRETEAGIIYRHYVNDEPGWGSISVWIEKTGPRKYTVGHSFKGRTGGIQTTSSLNHATEIAKGKIGDFMRSVR